MLLFAALIAALSVAVLSSQFHDLRQQLTEEEWLTLIGQEETGALYDIVHPVLPSRHRRTPTTPHQLLLDAPVLQKQFTLDLQPATSLLDPRFALVSRWGNRSEQLPMDLVETDCYFTSVGEERAAVSVCGGVRGVIKPPGDEYYVINPLPKRFTKRSSDRSSSSPHVIVRKHISHFHTDLNRVRSSSLNSGDSFCGVRSEAVPIHNTGRVRRATNSPVHVETAVFVDSDMFNLMSNNFPTDTEREVVRFVLAMVNAVQLLYHDPSLGQPVTFVMKRLEILHTDPSGLVRYHDIDKFLGNFCAWQREENPVDDADPLHWDHALILTGLDLFVRSKNGKFSSQVVGLAPVAGMCTPTSSCTVNEGRHFESVYVVAHEIGHNLGMRHDGPLADNNCDPTSYLMSPTLGSGKITWSECSRHYLLQFLRSPQSHCLMDHNDQSQLDHSSHGALPGERFDADQQCMLKYGAGSRHASSQPLHDLCRDLHCHRDRYTWTSHPALEGTTCGTNKWCRSGRCVPRSLSQLQAGPVSGQWGPWGPYSECASGCLQGEPSGLGQGSTGIMFAYRQCNS
ncbi:A disintegrin and metalloproteinase with thrombospondin motifs 6-like [Macrosteles quadrilineatus]|uniref:A disintegrin and metalloproteinase with thrombospondin motifs 6-like n=1 Tax=Macrosteles quadrilineatus TaxID=74068 RepID=UPI0023E285B5|nr:A disintegrin and metalloproteinase with thrombospondin motifs 6-like [Macrosteles quadrilineatus]